MELLVSGLIVFMAIHLLPSMPLARQRCLTLLGEIRYKLIYSLISAVGFGLIVWGMIEREFIPLWEPPSWGRHAALVLMLPAMVLLSVGQKNNLRRLTRHPMLLGILLWAVGHLLANGDLAMVILCGSFAVFAVFDLWSVSHRGVVIAADHYPISRDLLVVAIGLVGYVGLLFLHPYLFGVPILY